MVGIGAGEGWGVCKDKWSSVSGVLGGSVSDMIEQEYKCDSQGVQDQYDMLKNGDLEGTDWRVRDGNEAWVTKRVFRIHEIAKKKEKDTLIQRALG